MQRSIVGLLVACTFTLPAIAEAQFVIEGVIHESGSLSPIADVAVLLVEDDTGAAISPGVLGDPAQQGQLTGDDGRYEFSYTGGLRVRVVIERPDVRFIFPSALRPPAGGGPLGAVACSTTPCLGGQIDPVSEPREDGTYALRFATDRPGDSARNNHIPIDRLDELITSTLDADRLRVRRGQHVVLTATFESGALERVEDFEVVLAIPPSLRVVPSSVLLARRSSTSTAVEVTPRQTDLLLRVGPTSLGPNERVELRLAARAVQIPDKSPVTIRTWLERPGGIVVSNESALRVTVEGDPTLDLSTVYGRVFCDDAETGRPGWQDEGERGVYGARVYLDTGFYAEADRNGLFHFSGVPAGTHVLKLDRNTLPSGSEPVSPELSQIYLAPGTPAKVRFAVRCVYDAWKEPTKVFVKTTTVTKPTAGRRTVDVGLAVATRALTIADRLYQFSHGTLGVEMREGGARFHAAMSAPFTPTRWRFRVTEVAPSGEVVRSIEEVNMTGRGMPPLVFDWRWDRPPNGVYRVRLEVDSSEVDSYATAPVDFGGAPPTPPAPPKEDVRAFELIETVPMPEAEFDVRELALRLAARLAETPLRVVVVSHWDGASDDPIGEARRLGERLAAALVLRGVSEGSIEVQSAGASSPIFPNLSARLRVKNRRVDVRVAAPRPPPPPPAPKVPPPERQAPQLIITVDSKSGAIPLDPWKDVGITIDLDTPATLTATLIDPSGGVAMMRRTVTHNWVTRVDAKEPQAIVVSDDGSMLTVGDAMNFDLTAYRLEVIANEDGVQITSAMPPVHWDAKLFIAPGWTGASASGYGAIPKRVDLSATSSVAVDGPALLVVRARFADGTQSRRSLNVEGLIQPPSIPADADASSFERLLSRANPTTAVILRVDGPRDADYDAWIEATQNRIRVAGYGGPVKVIPGDESLPLGGNISVHLPIRSVEETPLPYRVVLLGASEEPEDPVDVSGRTLHVIGPNEFYVPIPALDIERARPPGREGPKVAIADVAAADVIMEISKTDGTLTHRALPIRGTTRPTNRIRVNGTPVAVDERGGFVFNAALEPGENVVRVETEDELGNRATFERRVATSSTTWFLMAVGEAEVGLGGSRLAGSNADTHVDAGPFSLDGRAIAYGKASVALDGVFEKVEVVGRIDTGQRPNATITRLEDDPLRLMPAFGDESVEVQETSSRYKIDLTVRADDSSIAVGNRTTTLSGFADDGYFGFRGAGFGVHGNFEKRFGQHDETRIRGMVGFENDGSRRGHDELLGSGGTMYWLSGRDLIEGSERVRLVVRDRDTGHTLETVERARGTDYEIRPHEGRIVFREPIPHVVGAAQTAINRSVALTGHPIYIVVDYVHLDATADDTTFGIEARETLFDAVEVYGAAAGESGVNGKHRLYGLGLAYRPTGDSFLEFEYAHASGATPAGRLSNDGGLTFNTLDLTARAPDLGDLEDSSGPFFGALDGNAMSLVGQLSIADLYVDTKIEDRPNGYFRAYGKKAGLLFSSIGSARQSGRLEGGFAASYDVTDTITARAAFDAAVFVTPETIGAIPAAQIDGTFRGLLDLGVTYRTAEQGIGVQLLHLHTDPMPVAGSASSTGFSLRYERQLTEDLTIIVVQDAIMIPDGLTNDGLGILGTTAGLSYQLTERLDLDLFETVRWNGDNATQLGIRFRGDDGFSMYVAERFASTRGEPVLATVIGAEDIVAEGSRTYGELHLGGAAHPTTTRAVIGMDNRWRVMDGVDLVLGYERAHLMSDTVVPNSNGRSPFTAPFGGLSSTLGGFGAPVQILPGAVSRDALVAGISFTGIERLKLSTRLELRIDDGDQTQGGRDFRVVGAHVGGAFKITEDFSALGRLTTQHVQDTLRDVTYAKAVEASLAAAFRPRVEDWFTLIVRYTRLDQQRPRSLTDDRRVAETRDALSIEPIIDTPWNVQLVERVALVSSRTAQGGLSPAGGLNVLWINRVNARPVSQFEGGLEYRMLLDLETETAERGFLAEVGYLPDEHVRIGVGYNFTRFSDDVLTLLTSNARGPFLRVTARY